jgi:hypothetical protein
MVWRIAAGVVAEVNHLRLLVKHMAGKKSESADM